MTTNANESTNCPSCGKSLPAGALAGLCPACLLAQGAETEAGGTQGRSRFEPPALEDVAKLFPQLEVMGMLGAGGMGAVYQARQPRLDRIVALKILPAGGSLGSAERFNREARALARLSHPNIVAVHEFGQVEGLHFFIMEFVDGTNLRQLEKTSRLSPREALQIIPQICDALQYAHDEGVVHRDIKPENVLVDRKGRVKIADFGLAKIVDPDPEAARLTVEGQVMGTPHYMAPEQVERPLSVDHRADIYALGVVFYEMLTGDLPLGKFPPPSRKVQVDVRLDDIVLRALENDPERRYQQASEVKSEVQTVTNAPAPQASESASGEGTPVVTASFPLTEEREDQRTIAWKEVLRAWAIIFGLLTLAFALFSSVTGKSLMGWLGVVGWQSLVYRSAIGGILVAVALRHAMRPEALLRTTRTEFWWRSRLLRIFVFVALAALASTWMIFQDRWLMPRVLGYFSRSEYGDLRVARKSSDSGNYSVTLPNGSPIELLAMAPGDAEPNDWRGPDGRALDDIEFEIHGVPENQGNSDRPTTRFIFRQPAGAQFLETSLYEFSPSAGISAGGPVFQDGQKLDGAWPLVAAWNYATNRATLRLGLRYERWRTIAALTPGEPRRVQTWAQSGEPKWITHFNHISDDGKNTTVTAMLNSEMKDWRLRIVAVGKDGREHDSNQANISPFENSATWTCTFPGLTQDQIKEIQVQAKPVHWIEFRDVMLPSQSEPASRKTTATGTTRAISRLPDDFTPEMEAEIPEPAGPDIVWFDLDVNRLVSLTNFFKPGWNPELTGTISEAESRQYQEEFKKVRTDSGVDISARIDGIPPEFGRMPAIIHRDMVVVPVNSEKWDRLTPEELRSSLVGRETSPRPVMEFSRDDLATYLFQTFEGSRGILQLMDFTTRPRSIHIRYRLLVDPNGKAQNQSTNPDGPAEVVGGGKFDTIQAAVDAAPDNAVIRISAGHFAENLVVTRPLTLLGAGWERTTIESASPWHEPTETELAAIQKQWSAASTPAERMAVQSKVRAKYSPPVISIQGVQTVRIEGIQFHLAGVPAKGKLLPASVVNVADSTVTLRHCAIVGSPANGLVAESGADVSIEHCLVAGVWNTGIRCESNAKVTVTNSDIRNCYYAGIRAAAGADLKVNGSRISGAAWHGIRYDSTSPEIVGNLIFNNARSGIYASGDTKAMVRGNVFFGNEMGGMSCWFNNADLISGNTFSGNKREALSVLGASFPQIVSNVFVGHPVAITQGLIGGQDPNTPLGKPDIRDNIFWNNESVARIPVVGENHQITGNATNLPPETHSLLVDPGLGDASEHDFQFERDSPAVSSGIGAQSPPTFASSFPLQPEEQTIIPEGDTRDYRQWKHPAQP